MATKKSPAVKSIKQLFLDELFNLCVKHKVLIESAKIEFASDAQFPLTIDFLEGRYPIRNDTNAVEAVDEVVTVKNKYSIRGTRPEVSTTNFVVKVTNKKHAAIHKSLKKVKRA